MYWQEREEKKNKEVLRQSEGKERKHCDKSKERKINQKIAKEKKGQKKKRNKNIRKHSSCSKTTKSNRRIRLPVLSARQCTNDLSLPNGMYVYPIADNYCNNTRFTFCGYFCVVCNISDTREMTLRILRVFQLMSNHFGFNVICISAEDINK